jgi:hypothetical protein
LNDVFVGEYHELLTDLLWNQLMADNKMTTREELEEFIIRYFFNPNRVA